MTVWGAADVEAAAGGRLHVGARDVVTPLARERARDLGVEIVAAPRADPPAVAPPRPGSLVPPPRSAPGSPRPSPVGPVPDEAAATGRGSRAPRPVRPPSGALYRRGAPVPPGTLPPGGPPRRGAAAGSTVTRTGRVVVVGAGNVGTVTGTRLAEADVFDEVVLVDVDEGRAAGVALDLAHTAALSGFGTRARGVATVEAAGPAEYVVVTAGRPRGPGMSRSDLTSTNAAIVGDVAQRVAATSPHAVIVVVTNPLDEMTHHAWLRSGLPAERVLGMAGVLDTARFQALAALAGAGRAADVRAWALGSHGEEMVVPLSQAAVDGTPLEDALPAEVLRAVVDRTRGSGAEVVGLLGKGSAFLAPGLSAARMVLAMAADSGEVLPAAVLADGSYGIRGVYVGLPARLGRRGLREIVELDLRPEELTALRAAADRIRGRLGQLATTG